ncbi:MAG: hypothetical protein LUI60_08015 [Clostridia bacterium]|nr:hypothetical protein [Clostridia bacterium]
MEQNEIKNQFLYKYGFLLTKKEEAIPLELKDNWVRNDLPEGIILMRDARVKCTLKEKNGNWLCLCGTYCMDTDVGHMNFEKIAENLLFALNVSKNSFYDYVDNLNGRFFCIYSENGKISFFNDAAALQSVYYYTGEALAIASHYNLVWQITGDEDDYLYIKINENSANSSAKIPYMPACDTPYKNIKCLLPNHCVKLQRMEVSRFYPRSLISGTNVEFAASEIANTLKREVIALSKNYKICYGITSSKKDRVILSAMKEIMQEVLFYTYHTANTSMPCAAEWEKDYLFANDVAERYRFDFKELIVDDAAVEDELKSVLYTNHYKAEIPYLMENSSIIFKDNTINVIPSLYGLSVYSDGNYNVFDKNFNAAAYFATSCGYDKKADYFAEAEERFNKYYSENYSNIYNYSAPYLFMWEFKYGKCERNAKINGLDILSDSFMPLNCRKILDLFMRIPVQFKKRDLLYDLIIEKLWSELLDYNIHDEVYKPYHFIDKNGASSGQLIFDERCKFISGNLVNKLTGSVATLYESRKSGATIGFESNKINEGDYCAVSTNFRVNKDNDYCFQFTLKTDFIQGANGGVEYQILIDDKVVYKLSTMSFYMTNQIMYCFKAAESKNIKIQIRLVAVKAINNPNYNGIINILDVQLKRLYGYNCSNEPEILDTFSSVNSLKK